jgi:hypothetical protein
VTEQQLHRACAEYLAWALKPPTWFTTFPAGGGGEVRGKILRGLGLKPGVPDLLIVAFGVAHWVELKTQKGKTSVDQVICHGDLIEAGCPVAVVRSLYELQATLDRWLVQVCARLPE